jgi:hypothetical protein
MRLSKLVLTWGDGGRGGGGEIDEDDAGCIPASFPAAGDAARDAFDAAAGRMLALVLVMPIR